MNEMMQARFAALFANYGEAVPTSVSPATQTAKNLINSYLERDRNLLRSDACLLLISLYDNMVAQPFSQGQVLLSYPATEYYARIAPDGVDISQLSRPQQEDTNAEQESLGDLSSLLDRLANLGHPATSGDVIKLIQESWFDFNFSRFGKGPNPII